MPEYLIYKVGEDRRLLDFPHVIVCDADEAAIEKAGQMVKELDLEVW